VDGRVAALSYFFPAHNEAENIEPLVAEALAELPRLAQVFEIICVDDGSRDGTAELADRLAAEYPDVVRVVHHPINQGYGGALRSGLRGRSLPVGVLHRRRPPSSASPTWAASLPGWSSRRDDQRRPCHGGESRRLAGRGAGRGGGATASSAPTGPSAWPTRVPIGPACECSSGSACMTSTAPASCSGAKPSRASALNRVAPSCQPSCSSSSRRVAVTWPRWACRTTPVRPAAHRGPTRGWVLRAVRDFWLLRVRLWAGRDAALRRGMPVMGVVSADDTRAA